MTAGLILWTYALAALLFVVLALSSARAGAPRIVPAALCVTATWLLAVAGLGPAHVAAGLAEGARDLVWLLAALRIARDDADGRGPARLLAFALAAGIPVALMVTAVVGAPAPVQLGSRMLMALAGVILLGRAEGRRGPEERLTAALAMLWGVDLFVIAPGFLIGWTPTLVLARGVTMLGVGAAFALAAAPRGDRSFGLSRGLRLRAIVGAALFLYMAAVVAATGWAADLPPTEARIAQTAIVVGATTTLAVLASTSWLRAWTRVVVEKHLFGHRYDYRSAWARFTGTLGRPGEDGPLPQRVVQAVADLVDAPAGLLLARGDDGLEPAAGWRWEEGGAAPDLPLAEHLERTGRIVELDRVRDGLAPPEERAAVPAWMTARAEAWALVPLTHLGVLVGAILLARPPVARPLDWEDLDLLRLAGAQAASYLAEDRAHVALADVERFDEFNRRFAFILHDIKNLVSQMSLVARNAERHGDDPAFRADMVATLKDSAERMTALVQRLTHRPAAAAGVAEPVDLAHFAEQAARSRRAQHPVVARTNGRPFALADAQALAQALGHLVQNAVEASPAGVAVEISARVEGCRAVVEVADRGCGMSAAFVRDRLFRPFSSSKPGGFGLGAFEARQLVRAMGGALEVESREGEGTRFRIVLPAAPEMEQAA
ncbi:XrtA/PEP-CTERM system histidine kinase PrsK [Sphingomonas lenta]|uniref:histidine kinase n=1 Tax=Sphingomonas lenta TaxID=1141887 RepID=A0A2A2SD83_9SPHN|nr:XrtA/PEP-CTERM system histidine kinase PrsK [Sphingomonas lenta]PAX07217.1 PEP-CTERM system histidine kinase PrsK [Sphingomonas lenta]